MDNIEYIVCNDYPFHHAYYLVTSMDWPKFQATAATMTLVHCYESRPEIEVSAPPFA